MIEFTIVALPLLLLALGGLEISHWLFTRQAVGLALLDAGRAAITDHNRPSRIVNGFEHALQPLYAAPGAMSIQRLRNALASRQKRLNAAPWQIEVLSPSPHAYIDHADPNVKVNGASGHSVINNHYLAEQDQRRRNQGWADGRGPVSDQTIYEANTLVLRLSWLHEPRLPLLTPLLRALGNPAGNYRQRGLAQGYVPMVRQLVLLMQSHPVHWNDDPSEKVIYRAENEAQIPACRGWLCQDSASHGTGVPGNTPIPHFDDLNPAPPPAGQHEPGNNGHPPDAGPPAGETPQDPGWTMPPIDPDDPACGVTLCCV